MRLLVGLLVLALLAVAADVAAEESSEARLGEQLASSIDGAERVEVEVRGRPFLLQVARGRFAGMDLLFPVVERDGIEVRDVELAFDGVEFSLGELIDGSGDLHLDRGSGTGSVTEQGLNAALRKQGVGARVRLDGSRATVAAAGTEVEVEKVEVVEDVLEFTGPVGGAVQISLPRFIRDVTYRDAMVQDSRVVVSIELPSTSIDPDSL